MISPQMGQAAFRLGMFITLVAGVLALVTDAGTPEKSVSILMFGVGIAFLALVAYLARRKL